MRLIFAGTPPFAASALHALLNAGHDIALVLTQPDRPAGRGLQLQASAVKILAQAQGLTVAQPVHLKDAAIEATLRGVSADAMIVAAYGLLLPQPVLDIPRLGCLNIHASLLPRWRGAAPIQRALLAGDTETGITIMQMDAGLDSGPMLSRHPLAISVEDTAQSLHDKLAALGAEAIVTALSDLCAGRLKAVPQDASLASYAPKLNKAEARIDWRQNAGRIQRAIRAYDPFPGAHTTLHDETIKIWAAEVDTARGSAGEILRLDKNGILVACGEGAICITALQRAGGKRLSGAQLLGGTTYATGMHFI